MFLWNQWTAVKTSSGVEDLQEGNKVIGGHRFGAGLGGSDAFVSQGLFLVIQCREEKQFCIFFFSVLFIPEYGWRMAFYVFQSSTWPSRGRPISRHLESLWPFIWQAVVGPCVVLGDAARGSSPGFSEDTCSG